MEVHYYVKSTRGPTSPDFKTTDITGKGGRLDIIARSINAALWLSHGMRRNVVFHTILHGPPEPPVYIRFEGSKLRKVQPDEQNIIKFIKKALERMKPDREVESTPGVFVTRKSFQELLEEHSDKEIILLDENGGHGPERIQELAREGKNMFIILGDYEDLTPEEKNLVKDMRGETVGLGPVPYLASHCIVITNWLIDTARQNP